MELQVPSFGESITEVLIAEWLKSEGDQVAVDEEFVVIETDKVTMEMPAPVAGKLTKLLKAAGDTAKVGEVIAILDESAAAAERPADAPATPEAPAPVAPAPVPTQALPAPAAAPAARAAGKIMPAARRLAAAEGIDPAAVAASGPGGRVLKEDVQRHAAGERAAAAPVLPAPGASAIRAPAATGGREEELVQMSPLRIKAAEHLLAAQRGAALLTTFNEVDMSAVIALRKEHQEAFVARHGVKLGFMSFFVKAAIEALKLVPQVNAEIRGNAIAYRNYYDVGIAVGGGKGLVVPIVRNAERLSFAEVEKAIADYGERAKGNKLKIEELIGGTFTISNGGIYGSMLSTPIVNAPQSGILGLHAIKDRAVVEGGEIVARPMMYVALTYDHRIVDGREAVTFLKRIKECVEAPSRILLEI